MNNLCGVLFFKIAGEGGGVKPKINLKIMFVWGHRSRRNKRRMQLPWIKTDVQNCEILILFSCVQKGLASFKICIFKLSWDAYPIKSCATDYRYFPASWSYIYLGIVHVYEFKQIALEDYCSLSARVLGLGGGERQAVISDLGDISQAIS